MEIMDVRLCSCLPHFHHLSSCCLSIFPPPKLWPIKIVSPVCVDRDSLLPCSSPIGLLPLRLPLPSKSQARSLMSIRRYFGFANLGLINQWPCMMVTFLSDSASPNGFKIGLSSLAEPPFFLPVVSRIFNHVYDGSAALAPDPSEKLCHSLIIFSHGEFLRRK